MIGPINLDVKQTGERSAGKPQAAFDVAGAGNVTMAAGLRSTAKAVERPPEPTFGGRVSGRERGYPSKDWSVRLKMLQQTSEQPSLRNAS